ncbi:histidine--tRNA ligase [Sulfurospirillum sp. 1612]|uniref:histidine--tRNA ligase n=1 Tax=Sulfurospirillum sp. 1612 TaxID=3094835 RepID=UPI002F945DF6
MIQALRGMKDLLDPANERYLYFTKHCSRIAENYGFTYIETPLLEETALFKRSVGESSDIVGKEMYQFTDKGGNDVCLRPEGTAGVVRAFIQQKYDKAGGGKKFYYYGPMFRYERPQKGRLREFHQFGVESFGESNVKEDASIILMLKEMLDFFGIGYVLELNSLGCHKCMPPYREKLVQFLEGEEDICDDCKRRKDTNPIRVLDCKNEHCKEIYRHAPLITDNLCEDCQEDFSKLTSILDSFGVKYVVNSKLVRGLDYYNKTAFEFVSDEIGAQSAIAGGGRYDRLVEFLDGKPTYGIGFAMGIERLMELIKMPEKKREGYYVGALCEEALDSCFELSIALRREEKVVLHYEKKSLKAHLKNADKQNARFCICIGEDELVEHGLWMKDLENKEEHKISISDFLGD